MSRPGRRPGTPDTRAEVLAAARRRFAEDGYDNASIRAIAAEADVDPALVHHYFGAKRDLFRAAVAFPLQADEVVGSVAASPPGARGEALARTFLDVWESPATGPQLQSVLRSAMTHEDAAALLRQFVVAELLGPVARDAGITDPLGVTLAASQMVGVAVLRYLLQVEPLASADRDEVVTRLAPVLQAHLFG